MCILIAKPRGVKKPSIDIMKKCWDNNPDGAGLAFSDDHKIIMRKGFMKWSEFKEEYENLNIDNYNAIIHFRVATHGTVKPSNTHPFNVSDRIVAAHNGVLSVKNEGDWTDSETFFKRICAPILQSFDIESDEFKLCVEAIIGTSKLAFLTDNGKILTFGNFVEDDGVYYSNTTYMYPKYSGEYYGYGYYGYGYNPKNYGGRNGYVNPNYTKPHKKAYSSAYVADNVSVLEDEYTINIYNGYCTSIRNKKTLQYVWDRDDIGKLIEEKLAELAQTKNEAVDTAEDEAQPEVLAFVEERKWEDNYYNFQEQSFYKAEAEALCERFDIEWNDAITFIEDWLDAYETEFNNINN